LTAQLKTLGLNIKEDYFKITNIESEKLRELQSLKDNDLVTIVYNFVDMLSHAKQKWMW
jgi:hypothetical protein